MLSTCRSYHRYFCRMRSCGAAETQSGLMSAALQTVCDTPLSWGGGPSHLVPVALGVGGAWLTERGSRLTVTPASLATPQTPLRRPLGPAPPSSSHAPAAHAWGRVLRQGAHTCMSCPGGLYTEHLVEFGIAPRVSLEGVVFTLQSPSN